MFEDVYKILNNAKNLNEGVAFRKSVTRDVKDLIIHLNTVIQLGEHGIDSEDDSLGDYSLFTVEKRSELGLQTGHVDFKVTGDYWNSWKVIVKGDEIMIDVDNDRFDELVDDLHFSDTHIGLTDENINILTEKMLVEYRIYARGKLGI